MSTQSKSRWRLGGTFSFGRATILLASTALLSNVLGVVRNWIYFRAIPDSQLLDVFFASFRLPDLLFNLFVVGAISSAFIPVASELKVKGDEKGVYRLTNQLLSWLTLVFTIVSLVLVLTMQPIMEWLVGRNGQGFSPEQVALTVAMSRLFLLQTIAFAWSYTFGGFLNVQRRFSSYALAPLIYNVTLIVGGLFAFKYGLFAMAAAVLVGAVGHGLIQYLEARGAGYHPKIDLRIGPDLRSVSKLMLPRSVSQGMNQLVAFLFTGVLASLGASAISIYSSMNDMQTMFTVVVANSLALAAFPRLAEFGASGKFAEFNEVLQRTLRLLLFGLLPLLALSIVLRAQLVRLYFGIGGASWGETIAAIDTLLMFLIGVLPAAFVAVLARVFYALKDAWTPVAITVIAALAALGVGIASADTLGVPGVALASSVLSFVQTLLMLLVLYRHPEVKLGFRAAWRPIASYAWMAVLAGTTTWVSLRIVNTLYEAFQLEGTRTIVGLGMQLLLAGGLGLLVVVAYARSFHATELTWLKNRSSRQAPSQDQ